jgi:hypothetical protein
MNRSLFALITAIPLVAVAADASNLAQLQVEAERAASAAREAARAANEASESAKRAGARAAEAAATATKAIDALQQAQGAATPADVAKAEIHPTLVLATPPLARALSISNNTRSLTAGGSLLLSASSDSSNVAIKLTQSPDTQAKGNLYDITLSSPVAKGSTFTEPATLDGLANAASIGFRLAKYRPLDRDHLDTTPFVVYGGGAKVGSQQFSYFEGTSLAKANVTRTPYSLSVFAGQTSSGAGNILVLGQFEYQRAYKDADSRVLCPAGTAPVTCTSGPIGTPLQTTKRIFSLEARYTAGTFELSPTLSYDSVSKVKGIDVPIYFIGGASTDNKPAPFNAGLRVGWRSDTHHGQVGLFVGTPFSFWLP